MKRRIKRGKSGDALGNIDEELDEDINDGLDEDEDYDLDDADSEQDDLQGDEELNGEGEDDDGLFNEDLDDDYYGGGGGISPLQKHSDLLKELTNFAPYLKDSINGWLGLTWSETSQKYVQDPNITPIMNLKCAAWCISFLKTYARPNNIITDISKDHYKFFIQDVVETIWLNIGCRYEDFGIRDEGDLLRICVELEHAASLVLMGAGDGKYNKFLGVVTTRHETVHGTPQQGGSYGPMMMQPKKENIIDRFKNVIFGR